jgi:hypothetical protein
MLELNSIPNSRLGAGKSYRYDLRCSAPLLNFLESEVVSFFDIFQKTNVGNDLTI